MVRKQQQPACRPFAAATELQNSREILQDLRCSKSEEANRSDEPKECKSMQQALYHLQVAANDGFAATTSKQTNKTNPDAAGGGHGVCRRRRKKRAERCTHPHKESERACDRLEREKRDRGTCLPACLPIYLPACPRSRACPAYCICRLPGSVTHLSGFGPTSISAGRMFRWVMVSFWGKLINKDI